MSQNDLRAEQPSWLSDASAPVAEGATQDQQTVSPLLTWLVVLVTLLAFFLRTHQLDVAPPGFNYDEAAHALDAVEILQGQHIVWSNRSGGNPTLLKYLIAGSFALLGERPFSQRLFVVFMSTATIPALYLLACTMFLQLGKRRAQLIGLLAALGLATSFWHINHSRIGLEFSPALLFEVLCFYFLWSGFTSGKLWRFGVSGAWLGAALYIYPTARFVPVLLALFFVYLCLTARRSGPKAAAGQSKFYLLAFLVIALGAMLVFAPIGLYFISHPGDFFGRAQDTFFLNPVVSQGRPWARLLDGILADLGAFGITTDDNPLANVPGRSLLAPILAVLFWAGLAWSIYRFKRPPHAFCVMWWAILLIPIFLTPDRFPHFSRLLTVAPVTFLFPAIALDQLVDGLNRLAFTRPRLRQIGRGLVAIAFVALYGTTAVMAYQDYFFRWATNQKTKEDFYEPTVELAELMNADASTNSVYVLPCNTRSLACDYYTLDFCHREGAPYHVILMNEWEAPQRLTQFAQGKDLVKLIHLKIGKKKFRLEEADPKGLLDFLLERHGQIEKIEPFPAYDIVHYRLPSSQTDFTKLLSSESWHVGFGGELILQDSAWGDASGSAESESRAVPAGGTLWALLNWKATGDVSENYKTSLRLVDSAGHLITQMDHVLQNNWQDRTGRWQPGDEAVPDYYLLPIPYTTPPQGYSLEVVVYSPETTHPLVMDRDSRESSLSLGTVRVALPQATSGAGVAVTDPEVKGSFSPEISLVDWDLDVSRPYSPGERGSCVVYWLVKRDIGQNLQWQLEIEGTTRSWSLIEPAAPLGPEFPTSAWASGQLWRGVYDFKIPVETPGGEYPIVASLVSESGQTYGAPVVLGSLKIEGRARNFDVPPIERVVEARFEDKIRLLGYDLEDENVAQGGALKASLYWQALTSMDISYTAFLHVLDGNGQLRAQVDSVPGAGSLPTLGWLPGEVIADTIALTLSDELGPGQYPVEVGWYDANTGRRLSVVDDDGNPLSDHVLLPPVTVR